MKTDRAVFNKRGGVEKVERKREKRGRGRREIYGDR